MRDLIIETMRLMRAVKKVPFPIGGIGKITSGRNGTLLNRKVGVLTERIAMSIGEEEEGGKWLTEDR